MKLANASENFVFRKVKGAGVALYLNGHLCGWVCSSNNGAWRYLINGKKPIRSDLLPSEQAAKMALINHVHGEYIQDHIAPIQKRAAN